MDDESIIKYFMNIVDNDKDISNGIAAIKTLLMVLEKSNCKFQVNLHIFYEILLTSQYIIRQLTPYKS